MKHRARFLHIAGFGNIAAALFFLSGTLGSAPVAWAKEDQGKKLEVKAKNEASKARAIEASQSLELQVFPEVVDPGGMFRFTLKGSALKGAKTVSLAVGEKDVFETHPVAEGVFQGFGAIRVTQEGKGQVQTWVLVEKEGSKKGSGVEKLASLPIELTKKAFPTSRLTVSKKFTSPSKAQKARTKEDNAAFQRAYDADKGVSPRFLSGVVSPVQEKPPVVTSVYGGKRTFNGQVKSRHMGLDLNGEEGNPVFAVADGVVRLQRDCFYAGQAIVLSHGGGLFTSYFHLSHMAVSEGMAVKKGDLIGHIGSTGRVTGPHLHFGAKLGKVSFDPMSLLTFDFGSEGSNAP